MVRCELEPGRQVTEAELAERFGAGRAAVRTSLNRLYQERLVSVVPRQGYVVAPVTLKHVRDLAGVRRLLEPPAARMAAGRVDVVLLRRLDERYRGVTNNAGDPDPIGRLMQANAEFHLAVARSSGNQRLVATIADLLEAMERQFHLGFKLQQRSDPTGDLLEHHHAELIDALAAGDGERAAELMADQIAHSERVIVGYLMASSVLESVNLAPPAPER
jgi:DNA-binding GntR family transcriptional regulator